MGTVVGLTLPIRLRQRSQPCPPTLRAALRLISTLGLILGIRHLARTGASMDQLRPARRLPIFTSVVTLHTVSFVTQIRLVPEVVERRAGRLR
jgi:hypothetical protein